MIVLTDHTTHAMQESIYPLLKTMSMNTRCESINVVSRGNPNNDDFFYNYSSTEVYSVRVTNNFIYSLEGDQYIKNTQRNSINDFDILFLRLDMPVKNSFFKFLVNNYNENNIINNPSGIMYTGDKDFLLNFKSICPTMQLCKNIEDILLFKKYFPIVLKPIHSYGGKGMIKIDNDTLWYENVKHQFSDFLPELASNLNKYNYLAMEYLQRVSEGDKRIIIVNGKIMGATLRYPKDGSWICNLSMGGSSHFAEPDDDERRIAETISPKILQHGVVIYGFDTLVGNNGRRLLSEINTHNVGGLLEAELHSKKPIVQETSDLIWNYIYEKNK